MVDELSALQRAQILLYKRLQHVKSQTYAALGLVLLMAGLIVIFLATYHYDKPAPIVAAAAVSAPAAVVASHRTGKALVGGDDGAASSVLASNSIGDEDTDTDLLLKHLSRIATSTTDALTGGHADGGVTPKSVAQDLQVVKVNSITAVEDINRSDLDDGHHHVEDRLPEASHNEDTPTVKVFHANITFTVPAEQTSSTTPSSTTTSTSTSTTTTETAETESEPEPESSPKPLPPIQDTYNISIVIHSATVPNMDYMPLGRASDTFCDVFIDDVLIGSTPIVDNNNNPNWQYLLPKAYRVRKESSIRVDLLDRDHLKKDHIGGVVMLVGDLVNTNRFDRPVKFFHGRGDVWVTVKLL